MERHMKKKKKKKEPGCFVIHFELIGLLWDPYTPKINTSLSLRTERGGRGGVGFPALQIQVTVGHYGEKQRISSFFARRNNSTGTESYKTKISRPKGAGG